MENLREIREIFDLIGSTPSKNEKKEILDKHRDNELLKTILNFIYNPFILTGISSKKIDKKVNMDWCHAATIDNNITSLINYLTLNNTGKDEDIVALKVFIRKQTEESQEFIRGIITKNIKVGMTSSTINKVFGKDFIPEFKVMLAEKYKDYKDKLTGDFIVTQKLDGVRSVFIKENGSVKVFSRQGQPIEDLIELLPEFENFPDNTVFDGELLAVNNENLDSKTLYRKTVKITQSKGNKTGVEFHAFDMVPLEDFKQGKSNIICIVRKRGLESLLDSGYKYIKYVPVLYYGNDKSKIEPLLQKARNEGNEGIMVNLANAPYSCKRTKDILKVKIMESVDLKVTGYEEGDNKYTGMLGALVVDYKGFTLKVGGGYTDVDRVEIWKNRDDMIGKIIEVSYFEESENERGGLSLRFPVYKGVRNDKTSPSYN